MIGKGIDFLGNRWYLLNIKKPTKIKVNGEWKDVTDTSKDKFGTIVWYKDRGETRWVYLHEVVSR